MSTALARLAADFQIQEKVVNINNVTPLLILNQSPERWEFWVASLAGGGLFISTNPAIAALQAGDWSNGTPLHFSFRRDGGLVQAGWYAMTQLGGGTLHIIEVLYRPGWGG